MPINRGLPVSDEEFEAFWLSLHPDVQRELQALRTYAYCTWQQDSAPPGAERTRTTCADFAATLVAVSSDSERAHAAERAQEYLSSQGDEPGETGTANHASETPRNMP
jgi:hypothetical protein